MEQGTSLRSSQPRSAEKRLRKRKELDALVTNMVYSKVRPSNSGLHNARATRQLLNLRNSDSSETERFGGMEDEDEDEDEQQSSLNSKMTCSGTNGLASTAMGGSGRKFKAPYTLIRNGSARKGQLGSRGLRIFCQCLCYIATALVCFMTVGAIFWLHIQMKMQAQEFHLQLKKVLDERDTIAEHHHQFQIEMESLSSNQTFLKSNITFILKKFQHLTDSVDSLNSSMMFVLKSLEAAPLLKSLPSTVLQVQTELAELGSKLTDLESQLTSGQKEVHVSLDNIKDTIDNIKKQKTSDSDDLTTSKYMPREAFINLQENFINQSGYTQSRFDSLDSKFKEFATQITDQLHRQETRATKSWELLSQLEDNVQNVSAKAVSSEVLCAKNQEMISMISANLKDIETKVMNADTRISAVETKEATNNQEENMEKEQLTENTTPK